MTDQNLDREKLGDIIDDWLTDPDHIDTGFLADAILSSQWLADLIRREREQAWNEGVAAWGEVMVPRLTAVNPYTRKQEASDAESE